jgi:hypothetical protein
MRSTKERPAKDASKYDRRLGRGVDRWSKSAEERSGVARMPASTVALERHGKNKESTARENNSPLMKWLGAADPVNTPRDNNTGQPLHSFRHSLLILILDSPFIVSVFCAM